MLSYLYKYKNISTPPPNLLLRLNCDRPPHRLLPALDLDMHLIRPQVLDAALLLRLNRKCDILRAQHKAGALLILSQDGADAGRNVGCRDRSEDACVWIQRRWRGLDSCGFLG